jgi:multidrug efflux pump
MQERFNLSKHDLLNKCVLVIGVAPLGLIGIVMAMLPSKTPVGFVALLGFVPLVGIIIRNSVILIDQI